MILLIRRQQGYPAVSKTGQLCTSTANSTSHTWWLPRSQRQEGKMIGTPWTSSIWRNQDTHMKSNWDYRKHRWKPRVMHITTINQTKSTYQVNQYLKALQSPQSTGKMSTPALLRWSKYLTKMIGMRTKNKSKKQTTSENTGHCNFSIH